MFNLLCIIYICVYVWFHMFFCILFAIFIWGFLNFSSLEARCRVDSTIIEKRNCWPIPQLLAGIEPTRHSFYEFKGNPCQTFPCISNPIVTPRRGSNWQCDVIFQLEEIIRNHPNFLLSVSSCKCLRTGRTYTACLLLRTCLKGALMHRMSREMRFNRVHPMQSQDKQASCFFGFWRYCHAHWRRLVCREAQRSYVQLSSTAHGRYRSLMPPASFCSQWRKLPKAKVRTVRRVANWWNLHCSRCS